MLLIYMQDYIKFFFFILSKNVFSDLEDEILIFYYRNIEKKKHLFLDISDKSAAMKRAKKEAYFQVI